MKAKGDYYAILGLSKGVSEAEIKKAYRSMAMKHHPDKGGEEAKFKEIKEAYEVLSDSEKRQSYDQFGHGGREQHFNPFQQQGHFNDMFGDIFRQGHGHHQVPKGSDLQCKVEITLEEAAFGVTKEIKVLTNISCKPCNGSGAKPGTSPTTCTTCAGHGLVRIQQGFFVMQQPCPTCHGSGSQILDKCTSCSGEGVISELKSHSVPIPAGVDTGDNLKLDNLGNNGKNNIQSGDLYVGIQVKQHEFYTREGSTLKCEIPLTFKDACLGSTIKIKTLDGEINLTIPPETQTGSSFRLKGKGIKSIRDTSIGDLIYKVKIQTPKNLTEDQKSIINSLDF